MAIVRDDGRNEHIRISQAELDGIKECNTSPGVPWRVRAAVDILRHKHAQSSGYTDYDGMDQLPHQIESIHHIANRPGNIRFLLADEPGAGKTAVASSIMRELQLQGRADRVLVVVPAQLKGQWKSEIMRFAGLSGYIVESGTVSKSNPWPTDEHDILITSIDYAKRDTNRDSLARMRFDLVIVDEAHHMNSSGKNVSVRYRLGETLSEISTHLLFLTATPHRGKAENFRLLLKLLEPTTFSDSNLTVEEVANRKAHLFLRHLKRDMVDMAGNKLFLEQDIKSLTYEMSEPENNMYDRVTAYVRRQHARLVALGERLAPFVLLFIQKRMASSTYALQKTLENRQRRLKEKLDEGIGRNPDVLPYFDPADPFEPVDEEDDPEHESWFDTISGISAARTPKELNDEIIELDGLIESARLTAETKPDKKYEKLQEVVNGLGPDGKLLVFSEFVDTLDYLQSNIRESVCRIDGNMKQEKRDEAVQQFSKERRIMLATDAAREGINLQFCHIMINYDLPWSPIALEQRMGRLYRYGQKKDVSVHNLIAGGTVEGNVLERLFEKLGEIRKQYEAVDVIGTVLSDVDIQSIMTESVTQNGATDIEYHVQQASDKLKSVRAMLEHTPVDLEAARRASEKVDEQHTDGQYLVRMMSTVFEGLGGRIRYTKGKTRLDVPHDLRGGPFRRQRDVIDGPPERTLARRTKYYDHIESWITANCLSDLQNGSVFAGNEPGYIIFHKSRLKDRSGKVAVTLVQSHFIDTDGSVRSVQSDILYDLDTVDGDPGTKPDTDKATDAASDEAQTESDRMNMERERIWSHRLRAVDDSQIDNLRAQLGEYAFGSDERRDIEEQIEGLERWKSQIQKQAETDRLFPEEPSLVGWVKVVAREIIKQDTENIGMELSMKHERSDGWEPKDVSHKRNIGYDILSRDHGGRERHIEVKARCRTGPVHLTDREKQTIENDPNAVLHIHTEIGTDSWDTQVIEQPARLKLTERHLWEASKSELDRIRG